MKGSKVFASIGALAALNFALVFVFQWYLLVYFGAGAQTDIFFGTLAAPQFIFLVLSGSLSLVLIPILSPLKGEKFKKESWNYFNLITVLFVGIGTIGFFTVQYWVPLLLPGFTGDTLSTAIAVSRIQLVSMVLNASLSVLLAVHFSRENYVRIEASGAAANFISLVILYFTIEKMGIFAAVWATTARIAAQLFYLMPILGRFRWINKRNSTFPVTMQKLKPLLLGSIYYRTDTLVDRYLTSRLPAGDLTLFNFAQQIYGAVNSIVVKIFINTMVPPMAKAYNVHDMVTFRKLFANRLKWIAVVMIASALFIVFLGKPTLEFLLTYRNLSSASIERLWWLLILLFGLFAGGVLGSLSNSTFFASLDTRTPTVASAVLFTIYLPVKVFCFWQYGIKGLAISISIYQLVNFALHYYFLRKHKKV